MDTNRGGSVSAHKEGSCSPASVAMVMKWTSHKHVLWYFIIAF